LHLATRLLPTRIGAQHFDSAKIISAAGGCRTRQRCRQRKAPSTPGAMHQDSGTPTRRQSGCARALPQAGCRAHVSGTATVYCQFTPSTSLWARILSLAVALCHWPWQQEAAGVSSQKRSQRQQGKTPVAADKGKDCEYITMSGELVQRVVEAYVS